MIKPDLDLPIREADDVEPIEIGGPIANGHDPEPVDLSCLDGLAERVQATPSALYSPDVVAALSHVRATDRGRFADTRASIKATRAVLMRDFDDLARGDSGGQRDDSQSDALLELAESADLFHAPDGTSYADVEIDGHRETWPVRSRGFRRWLSAAYYESTGGAPYSEAMTSALGVLDARAQYSGAERPVCVRVGGDAGRIYLDLADDRWRAVEIDADGWRVVEAPPVRFRRAAGMRPLPEPVRGGSVADLRGLVNVSTDADFVLLVTWLCACLRNRGPYPPLVFTGEQGTGKSTASAMLRAFADPNSAPLRTAPKDVRDLFIAATNSHVLAWDNLSGIPPWLSDTFCRLATGGGFAVRALYTDGDETLFDATRPNIINGIEDVVTRPDLADRSIFVRLEPIPDDERQSEADLWARFEAARPAILGALLDLVSAGLRALPTIQLDGLPRMADYALWAVACETGAPWLAGDFEAAYAANRARAVEDVVEGDPVAAAVRLLVAERGDWTGTTAQLLEALAGVAGDAAAQSRAWPRGPRALTGRLARASTFLRAVGVEIYRTRQAGGSRERLVTLRRIDTEGK